MWVHEQIAVGSVEGLLTRPDGVLGLVMLMHGNGSSRKSSRNQFAAQILQRQKLATLLLDLLTQREAMQQDNLSNIALLVRRVLQVLDWRRERADLAALPVGLLGASTDAAAVLVAAAERPQDVAAIVSRSGRTDLAWSALAQVCVPTLLIVGGADAGVPEMNRRAYRLLACEKRLEVVPRATHLFAEAGAWETAAHLARDWFVAHFAG